LEEDEEINEMKKTLVFRAMLVVLMAAMAVSCASPAAPQPTEAQPTAGTASSGLIPLTFRLNWTLYGEHAPFFLGVDKGFYKDEGLDVTILEGSGSATVVKLLGNGTNVIGYADSATMMNGIAVGVPVTAVAVTFQSSPMSFIYRADHPRPTTIDQLPGTKVAITAGDASMSIFNSCLGRNNLTLDDVSLIQVSTPAAKETAVLEGTADTFLGYFVDQPLRMQKTTGVKMGWSKLVDVCNVNTLSSAIIVNNTFLKENPEIVRKFVRASQRAWAYTQEHPEEAAEIFAKHAEAFDAPLALEEIKGSLTLLHTPKTEGKPIGWSSPDDWTATQDVLTQYAGFKAEKDINVFFTNDFISQPPYMPTGQ
jgi:NitT/TauT family transport system substrate-binding protein